MHEVIATKNKDPYLGIYQQAYGKKKILECFLIKKKRRLFPQLWDQVLKKNQQPKITLNTLYWMQNQVVAQNYTVRSISEDHALWQNRNFFLMAKTTKCCCSITICSYFNLHWNRNKNFKNVKYILRANQNRS